MTYEKKLKLVIKKMRARGLSDEEIKEILLILFVNYNENDNAIKVREKYKKLF